MAKIVLLGSIKMENIGGCYAVLFGLPFSLLLSYAIFKPTLLLDVFQEIADFGLQVTSLFWGIIYPILYLIILFISGRNITLIANKSTFQIISKLSFSSTIKIIAVLFFLFVVDKIINGISTSVIPITSLIVFSLIALLSIIFISTIINFIVSFFTVKAIRIKFQNKQNTN
ncbi:hypothetical protein FLAN108750_04225 [Flavobacterium antarcticum]|uniref:hypothetical protein n=1 Tax=Flavobacterium antarcticum TaxID=271155 RepID=UPI000403839C|nr:hypothetical protein [Flavobacterium antarcticum]